MTEERRRLNLGLLVLALVMVLLAGLVGYYMQRSAYGADGASGFWDRTAAVVRDEPADGVAPVAVDRADDAERQRTAAQLEAAGRMAVAFSNLRYDDLPAGFGSVRVLATGRFLKEYNKSTVGLRRLMTRSHAVRTGQVVWSGLVAGDDDSATVLVTTEGTLTNQHPDGQPRASNFRMRLELVLSDDRWLTRDLRFVE